MNIENFKMKHFYKRKKTKGVDWEGGGHGDVHGEN
jgi:hypothetical protein